SEGIVFDWHHSAAPGQPGHARHGLPEFLANQAIPWLHLEPGARRGESPLEHVVGQAEAALADHAGAERAFIWVDLPSLEPPWSIDEKILAHYFPEEKIEADEEPIIPWLNPKPGDIDRQDFVLFERLRSTYAAAVSQVDAALGVLVEGLREKEQLD